MMRKSISILLLLLSVKTFSQSGSADKLRIQADELELKTICAKLYHLNQLKQTDAEKKELNASLLKKFDEILDLTNSFENYQFDSLKNDIGILISPDKKFRIVHWNVPKSDGTHDYYGFIQSKFITKKNKVESVQIFPLTDKSSEIKNPDNAITDNNKWFGALYNKIIIKKTKAKTYYTLLGWDGNDKFSQKKIIDVLTFDPNNGTPKFGADIFNYEKKYPKRIIFEYSSTCSMSLKYSSKKDSIVFGHLAPTSPRLEGQFQYYCSDMSFDGFGFKKGKWSYGINVNALNEKDENDKLYGDPKDKSEGHNQSNDYKDPNKKKKKKKKTE